MGCKRNMPTSLTRRRRLEQRAGSPARTPADPPASPDVVLRQLGALGHGTKERSVGGGEAEVVMQAACRGRGKRQAGGGAMPSGATPRRRRPFKQGRRKVGLPCARYGFRGMCWCHEHGQRAASRERAAPGA